MHAATPAIQAHKPTSAEYHAVTYKNTHGDGCAYTPPTNGSDAWKARHQRASELLNSDSERTTDTLLPEQSQNSYPMYEMELDGGGHNAPV